jgi:hypothetical protein
VRLINPHIGDRRGRIIAARLGVARHSPWLAVKSNDGPIGP